MAGILSQEEIDNLLGAIDENEIQNENGEDRIYLFFDYLKESGNITGGIEYPKIEFNFIEFRDLFTKANEVIERQGYNEQIAFLKDTIKTELSESVKALSGVSLKIEDVEFIRKSDDDFLYLSLGEETLKLEIEAEKKLLQKVTNACLGNLDNTEVSSTKDLYDVYKEFFKPILHKLRDIDYFGKNNRNLQYKFLMDNYQIYVSLSYKG